MRIWRNFRFGLTIKFQINDSKDEILKFVNLALKIDFQTVFMFSRQFLTIFPKKWFETLSPNII